LHPKKPENPYKIRLFYYYCNNCNNCNKEIKDYQNKGVKGYITGIYSLILYFTGNRVAVVAVVAW
jgi:hypothetical protein